MKVGLIAGAGDLPHYVIEGARAAGHDIFVIAIAGFASADAFMPETIECHIAEIGKMTKAFKKAGCTHVCFAGTVKRPNFSKLRPDWKGLKYMPGAIKAAQDGDDALLTYVVETFEKDGFEIVSPQDLCAHLLLPVGHLGAVEMTGAHRRDAEKACRVACAIGDMDIGQGAVVCNGLVLAVEAQEGTDAMLMRVSQLPQDIRGSEGARAGVLAKMVKPGQETRVDLPTIGPETVRLAAKAGLAGIVAESGGAFVLDQASVIEAANSAGLFISGLPPVAS